MLRVSISHLHRGARHSHQGTRFAQLSIMGVRRVANGGIGAVVPVTISVSDSDEFWHAQSPLDGEFN
jgi:hypothetical protein